MHGFHVLSKLKNAELLEILLGRAGKTERVEPAIIECVPNFELCEEVGHEPVEDSLLGVWPLESFGVEDNSHVIFELNAQFDELVMDWQVFLEIELPETAAFKLLHVQRGGKS